MKTVFYERTFSPDFSEHLSLWYDTVEMGFGISTHMDNIWGVLRLSVADGEKARALFRDNPKRQTLANSAVMRVRWYCEQHFWISEATEIPENVCLEVFPLERPFKILY